jgi:mannose-1-phosphate guanylyltransferase
MANFGPLFHQNMSNEYCVIMAGGVGSRFWPMSTQKQPKQFLDILHTGSTLLQSSYKRARKLFDPQNILVITNQEYVDLVTSQLPELPPENILGEPIRRNTAPCITYAAFRIKKACPTANIVVTPSDHLITDEDNYIQTLRTALDICREHNFLITLGIKPNRPETGYGYIQYKETAKEIHPDLKKVKTFTEKPDIEHARIFLESGEFLWNSGLFIWNVDALLNGLEKYLPDIFSLFNEGWETYGNEREKDFIDEKFPQCENVSIDYGLMEKATNVYVIPASFGWSDLGTWSSVHEQLTSDENGNAVSGKKILTYNTKNSLIVNGGSKVIVAEGLDGYIVVESEKALLIYPKDKEQDIRGVVSDIRMKWGEDFI